MKFEETLTVYLDKLKHYTEEQFLRKPSEDSWSIGQVYVHVLLGNEHFFLAQVEKCLSKDETKKGRKMKIGGKVVFLINGFPNIKFKMPKSVEVPPRQPENIAYVREKLDRALELVKDIDTRLSDFDTNEKTKHPAFGYLNAREWYRMSEMHFRHHVRQLERIERIIGI